MDEISLADELGDEFAELQKEFLDTTRNRVRELARLLDAAGGELLAGEQAELFRRIAHSVRGSGGSYGFASISVAACTIEKAYLAGEVAERLADLVAELEAEVSASIVSTLGPDA